ncbi:MAG: hypothetical protein LUE08_07085 [Akkermansiaceae bacterium]|nr:hypothetical protein [Akkermansiaceae bacterium]
MDSTKTEISTRDKCIIAASLREAFTDYPRGSLTVLAAFSAMFHNDYAAASYIAHFLQTTNNNLVQLLRKMGFRDLLTPSKVAYVDGNLKSIYSPTPLGVDYYEQAVKKIIQKAEELANEPSE